MTQALRIIVADDESLLVEELTAYLTDLGHKVVATAVSGKELVKKACELRPSLVVTDIKMPDMDGLEAARRINEKFRVPVVVVSAYHDDEFVQRATDQCVMSYLVKPIDEHTLKASITLAMRRFHEFEALFNENADLKQALQDRKVIERAKGILAKRTGLSEADAFARLQELASTKHKKMAEIAHAIIVADEAF